ncbi:heavy metal-binding domain-containing protein [Streptomyces yangpuensis]|uniref:heavy metal-binding domain-containing protein n=1 Tax=Streptomyces yangpuensis TaxID=1648182 RepID=UPI00364E0B0C
MTERTGRDVIGEAVQPADEGAAEDAMRRLARPRPGEKGSPGDRGGMFTSDLTVNEFLLVREAGFRPLGLVLGSSVHHVGLQLGRWSKNQELTKLSQAMYQAREFAMSRMEAEASALGADGIVGVRLDIEFKEFGSDIAEFIAVGTAVKADGADPGPAGTWLNNKGRPFTSDLSGQEFWTLIRAGYAPLDLVMGSCVYHVAHQRFTQVLSNAGRNVEIEPFTQALYEARELAMSRMRAEGEVLDAEGIVAVRLRQHSHTWGSHTTEFFAIGTAVRPLYEDHVIDRPTMVVGLDD